MHCPTGLHRLFFFGFLSALTFLAFSLSLPYGLKADYESGVLEGETVSTNPKERIINITATVEDITPPSVPILISPANGSLLAVSVFPFVWQQSTDDLGILKYQLFLNGSLYFDNIGPGNNTTSQYTHTVADGDSTLVPTSGLADGTYTWKIRVYDNNDNFTDSTTWTFTIDTTAPHMVITDVGILETSISSQDASTVPDEVLILYDNEPVVTGTTEGNATVQLTIEIPGQSNVTLSTTASGGGSFSFTLPVLPRDVTVLLTFLATDAAGNTATIVDVPLVIRTVVIEIPPPIIQEIIPIPPIVIEVPQLPEIREEIVTVVKKRLATVVPEEFMESLLDTVDTVSPIANSLLGFVVPLGRTAIALHFSGIAIASISPRVLKKTWRALYLLPPGERMGLVFDQETKRGVPYAVVKFFAVRDQYATWDYTSNDPTLQVMADADGFYGPVRLDPGQYTVEVSHKEYLYSMRDETAENSSSGVLYKGEIVVVEEKRQRVYDLLPMMRKAVATKEQNVTAIYRLPSVLLWFSRLPDGLLLPLALIMCFLAFIFFTPWNVAMAVLHLFIATRRGTKKLLGPNVAGGVLDGSGTALPDAVIQILPTGSNADAPGVSLRTDWKGEFQTKLPRGQYQVRACWFDGSCSAWDGVEITAGKPGVVALPILTTKNLALR